MEIETIKYTKNPPIRQKGGLFFYELLISKEGVEKVLFFLFTPKSPRGALHRGQRDYITPISSIEFATFRNPAILAPFT